MGADTSPLGQALGEFDRRLREQAAPVVPRLVPGLEPEAVRELLRQRFDAAPDELVTWFAWHNGVHYGDVARAAHVVIYGGYSPISLQAGLRDNARWGTRGYQMRERWLPILTDGGSNLLVVEVSANSSTRVILHPIKDPEDRVVGESLAPVVNAWLALMEHGLVWDPDSQRWGGSVDARSLPLELLKAAALI
jgi:hypothetical protein